MNLFRRTLVGTCMWIAAAMNACSQETLVPTHQAQLFVAPDRYGELIEKLDSALEASGGKWPLTIRGGPGLNELRGRDVLYAEYRLQRSEKWAFLTVTDVAKADTVELRVYATVLSDPQNRKTAMSRLSSVLAEFGATLTAKTLGT